MSTSFGSNIDAVLASPSIRDAEFIKLEVPGAVDSPYYFSTSFKNEVLHDPITNTDGPTVAYNSLGGLVTISGHQRDLSVTSYDTLVSLIGVDPTKLVTVLEIGNTPSHHGGLKGSRIEIYRGFYNDQYQLIDTPQLRYTGIVTSYTIVEERQQGVDAFTISLHCSSYKTVLENRTAGRYTSQASWQAFSPTDTSMNRVAGISKTVYPFGVKLA